jgi:hypothetical protein
MNPIVTEQTYEKLIVDAHSENEDLQMLAKVVSTEMFYVMTKEQPFNEERFIKMLDALPEETRL